MNEDGSGRFVDACGFLYLPLLLGAAFLPRGVLIGPIGTLTTMFPVATVPVGLCVVFVMVLCVNGYFREDTRERRLLRAGLAFGTFAFIYLLGNSLGAKGGIWYFIHLNLLLMLGLTNGVMSGEYYLNRRLAFLIDNGRWVLGIVFGISLLVFTPRAVWVVLDYVGGSYLALCAWGSLRKAHELASEMDKKKASPGSVTDRTSGGL